eukprot:TRINITY_DN2686_c0_g1_i2.p1 TRINITY_DN2686_c0_g1~~TRINITY_DN2686_c0_g1_i2.p1  ORF type:complete len:184 (+),score=31.08 TRINITY_DN2686_c0_g1_i2:146-697(+)
MFMSPTQLPTMAGLMCYDLAKTLYPLNKVEVMVGDAQDDKAKLKCMVPIMFKCAVSKKFTKEGVEECAKEAKAQCEQSQLVGVDMKEREAVEKDCIEKMTVSIKDPKYTHLNQVDNSKYIRGACGQMIYQIYFLQREEKKYTSMQCLVDKTLECNQFWYYWNIAHFFSGAVNCPSKALYKCKA